MGLLNMIGLANPFEGLAQMIAGGNGGAPSVVRGAGGTNPFTGLLSQLTSDDLPGDARALGRPTMADTVAPPVAAVHTDPVAPANVKATRGQQAEIESFIASEARARGIDPAVALDVARHEGGTKLWNRQSDVKKNGVREPSWGPFQLYMGGGLGNRYQKATGKHPSSGNPEDGKAAIRFALDEVVRDGWSQWYGAKAAGYGKWAGIGSNAKALGQPGPTITDSELKTAQASGDARREGILSHRQAAGQDFPMPPVQMASLPETAPTPTPSPRKRAPADTLAPADFSGQPPPEGRSPMDFAVQQYKVNKSTSALRSLGPGPTIAALTQLGAELRAPTIALTGAPQTLKRPTEAKGGTTI